MLNCTFEDGGNTKNLRHATVSPVVTEGNRILLVKRALYLTCGGKYGLPGGYMNAAERVFTAAVRETYEETGYETKDPVLFMINDIANRKNEDRQNLDLIVILTPLQKTGISDGESTEVKWFDFDNLPPESEWAFDHYDVVMRYLKFIKNPEPLPILNFEY